jgi:Ca2+/Na+ antiporter
MNLLILFYVLFLILIFIYRDDEKVIYKICFYILFFTVIVSIIKYTKTLGEEMEEENKIKTETINDKLEKQEKERYEDYVKTQIDNITWEIPR